MFRGLTFILVVITVALCGGCGNVNRKDQSQTLSFHQEEPVNPLKRTVSAWYDTRFTSSQICEDYEIFRLFLHYIQSPTEYSAQISPQINETGNECPSTYSQLAATTMREVNALKDYHTEVLLFHEEGSPVPGFADLLFPVITRCIGDCADLAGVQLIPLFSEVTGTYYAQTWSSKGRQAFEIERLWGKTREELREFLLKTQALSKTPGGNENIGSYALLGRKVIDLPVRSLDAVLRNISTNERLSVQLSYLEENRNDKASPEDIFTLAYPRKDYGCATVADGSKQEAGACLTGTGRLVAWLSSLAEKSRGLPNPDISLMLTELVKKNPEALARPLLLDLRGNNGGASELALKYACTFGDDRVLDSITKRQFRASLWPESFRLSSGRVIHPAELASKNNHDLVTIEPGWSVTAPGTEKRREREISFLTRFDQSESSCRNMRNSALQSAKWIVLTNGREFSAAETLLSFFQASHPKFSIVGATTAGGTGSPVIVSLPNTGTRLRLSAARQIADKDSSSYIIEGRGITPDFFTDREERSAFEQFVLQLLQGNYQQFSGNTLPLIVKMGLAINP